MLKSKKNSFKILKLGRKEFVFLVIVFAFCMMVMGSTYAYIYMNGQKANTMVGNLGTVKIELSIEKIVPSTESPLVPLLDDALENAIIGTNGSSACIDSNSNLSCQVYKINVTNTGKTNLKLKSTITLTSNNSNYTNLKWRELENPTTIKSNSIIHGMETSILDDSLILNQDKTESYYIAVWISEIGSNQIYYDYGSFQGLVQVNNSEGDGTTAIFGGE